MNLTVKKRIILSYVLFYIAYMSFFPFETVFLASLGYGKDVVAIVTTATAAANFLVQFYVGRITRKAGTAPLMLKMLLIMSATTTFLLFIFHGSVAAVVLSILPVTLLDFTVIGQLDAYTAVISSSEKNVHYSTMRAVAGLSGALSSTLFGRLYSNVNIQLMFYVHTAMILLTLISVLMLPKCKIVSEKVSEQTNKDKKITEISKWMLLFLGGCLIFTGWRANLTYMPILLLQMGGNVSHQGTAMAITSVSCMPVLLLYPRIRKRISIQMTIAAGSLAMAVRFVIIPMIHSADMFVLMQILEAVSYGLLQPVIMEIMSDYTTTENRSGVIAVWTGIQMALCTILANFMVTGFGKIMSLEAVFTVFAALALTGMFIMQIGFTELKRGTCE